MKKRKRNFLEENKKNVGLINDKKVLEEDIELGERKIEEKKEVERIEIKRKKIERLVKRERKGWKELELMRILIGSVRDDDEEGSIGLRLEEEKEEEVMKREEIDIRNGIKIGVIEVEKC